ncbi:MAG: hypothetical protein QF638_02265, partial [Acidimicrobiales bacterium]|nr:hypothetical protein [Acidimicrobiales bacterium]
GSPVHSTGSGLDIGPFLEGRILTTAVAGPAMDLIERYIKTRDSDARGQLVINYLPPSNMQDLLAGHDVDSIGMDR